MSLTAKQVEDFFSDLDENVDLFYDLDWSWRNEQVVEIDGTAYRCLYIEGHEGGEGSYQCDIYKVVRIGEQYFRVDGHYQSYEGSDWGRWYEVHGVVKPVTFWEAL